MSKFSSIGTPEWNLELKMPIESSYVRDSYLNVTSFYLNATAVYVLIEDIDNNTHCYVVGVDVDNQAVVYVREISAEFGFTPRSLHVVGNRIYVLLDGGNGVGYIVQLDNTLSYNAVRIDMPSAHYIELVADNTGLYILCNVDINASENKYAVTVVKWILV